MKNHYFSNNMFFRLLWPSMAAGISMAFSNIIDAVTVGSTIGTDGLAAIGIITPIYIFFNVIGYAFSVGGSIGFTQLISDIKEEEAVRQFNAMGMLLMLLSLLIMVLGNVFLRQLLFVLGITPDSASIYPMCVSYARILLIFTPICLLSIYLYDFLRCDNDPVLGTIGTVTGCSLDVILNVVFVVLLHMGVTGAAWATIIALTVNDSIMLAHFFRKGSLLRFRFLIPDRALLRACFENFKTGFSTSIQHLYQLVYELTANNLLLRLGAANGPVYVAVFDVILNVSYFTGSIPEAVVGSLQPIAATFFVEHNFSDLRYMRRLSLQVGMALSVSMSALLIIFAHPVAGFFGMHEAVADYAIRVFCVGAVFDTGLLILSGFNQSIESERTSGIIVALRYFILLLPLTVLLTLCRISLFWLVVPCCAVVTFASALILTERVLRQCGQDGKAVFSYTLQNDHKNIEELLTGLVAFCEEHGATIRQTNLVNMAVEEACTTIIQQAFTGRKHEYIQITIIDDGEENFTLHLRDSAMQFNPFSMKTHEAGDPVDEAFMDSVGIMMLKKKAKQFHYRQYQGFNVLMVVV